MIVPQFRDHFGSPVFIASLTIYSICLVTYVGLAALWLKWRRSNFGVSTALPWYTFGVAIVFAMCFYALSIAYIPVAGLSHMDRNGDLGFGVTLLILGELSGILGLYIILVPLTLGLAQQTTRNLRTIKLVNRAIIALVAVLMVPYIVMASIRIHEQFLYVYPGIGLDGWDAAQYSAAYHFIYFVAELWAVACFFVLCLHGLSERKVKAWALLAYAAMAITGLLMSLQNFGWGVGGLYYNDAEGAAFVILINLFSTASFVGLLGSAKGITSDKHDGNTVYKAGRTGAEPGGSMNIQSQN